ncbi:MAG: hypothetical protein ACHP7E_09805, partial [Burkholderiales bacterium]
AQYAWLSSNGWREAGLHRHLVASRHPVLDSHASWADSRCMSMVVETLLFRASWLLSAFPVLNAR